MPRRWSPSLRQLARIKRDTRASIEQRQEEQEKLQDMLQTQRRLLDQLVRRQELLAKLDAQPEWFNYAAAFGASCVSTLVMHPIDTLKIQEMASKELPPNECALDLSEDDGDSSGGSGGGGGGGQDPRRSAWPPVGRHRRMGWRVRWVAPSALWSSRAQRRSWRGSGAGGRRRRRCLQAWRRWGRRLSR